MNSYIKNFQLWEKMMLKNWDEYAKIITERYEALPMFDETKVHHWKALAESNETLWKRLLSRVEIIFVSGDEKYKDNPSTISILGRDYELIYWEGGQPYDTQPQMKADYERTGKLYISQDFSDHPVFTVEENIVFRSVHDFIVHIQGNSEFGLKGELQAYNLHSKLATTDAVPALFTEVVGQVCTTIVKGGFPEQKVGIIEGVDYYKVGVVDDMEIVDKELKAVKRFDNFQ